MTMSRSTGNSTITSIDPLAIFFKVFDRLVSLNYIELRIMDQLRRIQKSLPYRSAKKEKEKKTYISNNTQTHIHIH